MIDFDPGMINVRSKATALTLIAEKNQIKRMIEEIIPKHYLPYREVFEKKTFNEMLPRQVWDHTIELIPGSKPTDCKLYPLNRQEQEQLDAFLRNWLDPIKQISNGISILLHEKERWISMTSAGLSKAQ